MVMDKGSLKEYGNHDHLINLGNTYTHYVNQDKKYSGEIGARYSSFSEFIVNKVVQKSGYSDFSSKPNIFWVHAINYVLLGGTIFTVAWLCIAQTDEVVVVVGKLQPTGKVKQVRILPDLYPRNIYKRRGLCK